MSTIARLTIGPRVHVGPDVQTVPPVRQVAHDRVDRYKRALRVVDAAHTLGLFLSYDDAQVLVAAALRPTKE